MTHSIIQSSPKRGSIAVHAIGLVVSIIVCFSAGFLGSMATNGSVDNWYVEINKPEWNPPNWIFAPVWSTLFLMMAVAVWLVWKQAGFGKSRFALGAFAAQLVLNALWSVVFFGMKETGWACVEIAMLWAAIVVTTCQFYRHSKLAAGLMIPYLMWVSFASFLNFTIWQMN